MDAISVIIGLFSGSGLFFVRWIYKHYKEKKKKDHYEHDIFISYPMKALQDDEEKAELQNIINEQKVLINNGNHDYRIFASIDDSLSKEGEDLTSLTDDFEALKASREYLLIYPRALPSSVLMELGCALCMDKQITLLIKKEDDLPYLIMKRKENHMDENLRFEYFSSYQDLKKKLHRILLRKVGNVGK